MEWEGIIALTASAGLVASVATTLATRARQEGRFGALFESAGKRIEALERTHGELEQRVRHAQLNIAMLDERTKGGGE